ncbi:uridine kinase [Kitasatospora sp. MAP12-15]|uniref:hypothetical protein n=1 Tax=unclassified Kitasatospora TaxID=2633591 RepID=UPI0024760561|nr:hypothetical protein [Kitasatospora sp. MAP12-44]MDH6111837.1 uridine kinase [Kitasatospora sp. MAP12-44]
MSISTRLNDLPAALDQRQLVEELADLLQHRKAPQRPLVAGLTGMDTSGKSRLATELATELGRRGLAHQVVRIDDFHHPRSRRYLPELPEPEQYYQHSIDFERAAKEVLQPVRVAGRLETTLTLLDLPTDTHTLVRTYSVSADTIVLVEGVFLFRPEISDLIDLFVYLDVPEDVVLSRGRVRDVPAQGEQVMGKYHTKYLPAQRGYLTAYPPEKHAEVIVDNADWSAPVVLSWPATTEGTTDRER